MICFNCHDTGMIRRGDVLVECGLGCKPPSAVERMHGFVICRSCNGTGKAVERRGDRGEMLCVWQCPECCGSGQLGF